MLLCARHCARVPVACAGSRGLTVGHVRVQWADNLPCRHACTIIFSSYVSTTEVGPSSLLPPPSSSLGHAVTGVGSRGHV
eukprot:2545752-Rhodomonas_salina.4